MWQAGAGQGVGGDAPVVADQYVVFDLGANYGLSAAYLWQMVQPGLLDAGVKYFRLLASPFAPNRAHVANPPAVYDLTGFTEVLGVTQLAADPRGGPASTQAFELRGAANVRQVYLQIISSYATGPRVDIGAVEVPAPPNVESVAVNGGADQWSRVTEITVTFDSVVTFAGAPAAAFRLTRTGPGAPAGDVTLTVDLSGSTATRTVARLTFHGALTEFGSLMDGRYTLTVHSGQVSAGDQALDGDADGAAGGDHVAALYRLFGDANGDRTVNGADFNPIRLAFGAGVGHPNYRDNFDVNGDGVINGTDFNAFRTRFGLSLDP
jgi:hypothetical protein